MTPPPATVDPAVRFRWVAVGVAVFGLLLAAWQISRDRTPNPRHPAVFSTAWVSFALWAGAVGVMIPARRQDWTPAAARFRVAGWAWALGCFVFLVHLLVAFHLGHRWDHAHALAHVQAASGWGPGLYVSYLFGAVWAADVLWRIARPASYAARSRWAGWAVHGFLAFVTFNGAVVYAATPLRWVAAGVFAALGVSFALARSRRTR